MDPITAAVEAVTGTTPRPVRTARLAQWWRDVAFLHWPVDPDDVRPLLPPGTEPDVHDGTSWVGLVGFRMDRLGLGRGPGLPYLGRFCETNVRLYSVDAAGRRGVVFRSLDAQRLLPVLVARAWLRLPYAWSRMSMRTGTDGVPGATTYRTTRRWPGPRPLRSTFTVEPAPTPIADPSPLEAFLTGRWGLHTARHGRTLYLPNAHDAWPLHRARLRDLDDDLVAAAGLPAPSGPPPSVLWSPGVRVVFGGPTRLPRAVATRRPA